MPVVKTWIWSQKRHTRHDFLDGETVPAYKAFSNGMQYPGDASGGVGQTANCACSLEVRKISKKEFEELFGGT